MPNAPATHHIFVDFENVPSIDLDLIAGQPVRVTLLIGKRQQKLDLKLVQQMLRLRDQVALVEVGSSGRNALDLTLACYLGRAVQSGPGTRFAIVSRDKDFDPMIAHLKGTGVAVSRHDTLAAVPFSGGSKRAVPAAATTAGKSGQPVDRLARLASQLRTKATSRPRTKARMLARINTDFGGKLSDTEKQAMLDELVRQGVLSVDSAGRIVYLEK